MSLRFTFSQTFQSRSFHDTCVTLYTNDVPGSAVRLIEYFYNGQLTVSDMDICDESIETIHDEKIRCT